MTTHLIRSQFPTVFDPICTLRDKSDEGTKAVPIMVTADSDWLAIRPHGYGEAEVLEGYGEPILLEVWEGELRLLVSADINDPNKGVISLEGAREDRRREHRLGPTRHRDCYETPRWTVAVRVSGVGAAGALSLQLISTSIWFRCLPLPENQFEFAVIGAHSHTLQALAACAASSSSDSMQPALDMRNQHSQDPLSPEQRAAADAEAIERFRPQAQPRQRLWMETTFCGTWCGTYRLDDPDENLPAHRVISSCTRTDATPIRRRVTDAAAVMGVTLIASRTS